MAIAVLWVLAIVAIFIVLPRTLLAAYEGESFAWLNDKIAAHRAMAEAESLPERDRQWYADSSKRYAYRLSMFATIAAAVGILAVFYRNVSRAVKAYLGMPGSAFNLGVMRAVVFGLVISRLTDFPIAEFAAMPAELYDWPSLSRWVLSPIPLGPSYVSWALPAALATSAFAFLGLLSRVTVPLATLLAFTLLCLPNLTGKVDHEHHILLGAILLAFSRCGDGFSIDSLIRRFRGLAVPTLQTRTVTHGLPIRLIAVLLTTCYFFPGFWKACEGPEWVIGNTMQNIALGVWFQHETFEPLVRVDQQGGLASIGALATIVFEIGFLPALFISQWTRYGFASVGMLFHIMVRLTLGISFITLQLMYVAFFDLGGLLVWIRRRLGLTAATEDGSQQQVLQGSGVPMGWTNRLIPMVVAFAVIYIGLIGTGFTKSTKAWPVACYPTFASAPSDTMKWPLFIVTTESGKVIELDDDPIRDFYGTSRYSSVLRNFVIPNTSDEKLTQLLAEMRPLWLDAGEIDPSDPPAIIEVRIGLYKLEGPRRPVEPKSTEARFSVDWDRVIKIGKAPRN